MWYEDREEFGRAVSKKLRAVRRYDVYLKASTKRAPILKAATFDDIVLHAGTGPNLLAYNLVEVTNV